MPRNGREPPRDSTSSFIGNYERAEARYREAGYRTDLPALIEVGSPADRFGIEPPKQGWIVERCIPRHEVTMLAGDGGLGKTLAMQQLATCMAAGKDWLGLGTAAGSSLLFLCEDSQDELDRRQAAINRHYGISGPEALRAVSWASRVGQDNLLVTFDRDGQHEPTGVFYALATLIRERRPDLTVLDSLYDLFGGNENWRGQVRAFVVMLRTLALDFRTTVVFTAHPSASGLTTGTGYSGSTAWNASVRSRLYLQREEQDEGEPENPVMVLKTKKANYGPAGGKIKLIWKHGVLIRTDLPMERLELHAQATAAQEAFMDGLRRAFEQGQPLSRNERAPNYAPRWMKAHKWSESVSAAHLKAAMLELFDIGTLVPEKYRQANNSWAERIALKSEALGSL